MVSKQSVCFFIYTTFYSYLHHFRIVLQTITLDCEATPVLQIKTFRQKSGKVETSHYKATIARLRARLSIALSYNTLKGDMRVEGFPDVSLYFRTKCM